MSAGGLVLGDHTGRQLDVSQAAGGPVKLVAMADLRQDRLDEKHAVLKQTLGDRVDAPRSGASWGSTPIVTPSIA